VVTPDNPRKSLLRCPAFGGSLHAFQHVREAIDRTTRAEEEQVRQKLTETGETTVLPSAEEAHGMWTQLTQKQPTFTGNRKSRRRQEAQWRRGGGQ